MSGQFEWRTNDGTDDNDAGHLQKTRWHSAGWRRPQVIIALLLILGLSLYLVHRNRASTRDAREDILATQQLIHQADRDQDLALLRSQLAGNDLAWIYFHEQQLIVGGLYDRPGFGLRAMPGQVRLGAPEFLADTAGYAQITFTQTHQVAVTGHFLNLTHTAIYRQRGDRWLLAPPPAAFWGPWQETSAGPIHLAYPERDQDLSRRLVRDLQIGLTSFCDRLPELDCPRTWRLNLRFNSKPSPTLNQRTITAVADRTHTFEDGDELSLRLPAPTLVGIPTDEAGYRALRDGYLAQLFAAIIVAQVDFDCCRHTATAFAEAALTWQLAALDLAPWPWSPADAIGEAPVTLANQAHTWYAPDVDAAQPQVDWPAHLLVQFLSQFGHSGAAMIQAARQTGPEATFWSTMHTLSNHQYPSTAALDRAWLAWSQPAAQQIIPLPDQDLQLSCWASDISPSPSATRTGGVSADLYHYAFGTEAANQEAFSRSLPTLYQEWRLLARPADDGVLLAGRSGSVAATTEFIVWQDARAAIFSVNQEWVPVRFLSDSSFLAYNPINRQYATFSLPDCQGAGAACPAAMFSGYPVLNPAGDSAVMLMASGGPWSAGHDQQPVAYTDGQSGSQSLGSGKSPVWLDAATVAIIRGGGTSVTQLMPPAGAETTLVTADDLPGTSIQFIATAPADDNLLWLLTTSENNSHIVVRDLRSGNYPQFTEMNLVLPPHLVYDYAFSPTGRYFIITGTDPGRAQVSLHIVDTDDNSTRTVQFHTAPALPYHWYPDWSAGDEWLALPDNGYLRLLHLPTGRQSLLILPQATCAAAVWINR